MKLQLQTEDASGGRAIRPVRVIERRVYRGPHLFSLAPMIHFQIDLGSLEGYPTNRLPNFAPRLLDLLPGLAQHGCSYRAPGGFVRRLNDGTWLGHVIEHVALELQTLAGTPVSRGKTRSVKGHPGVYNILYSYRDEAAGLAAGGLAVRLVAALLPPQFSRVEGLRTVDGGDVDPTDVPAVSALLGKLVEKGRLGPTTRALVEEAQRRGIPTMRLDEHSFVQLGWGRRQKRLRASITSDTSQIAVELAANKEVTRKLLSAAGLPVAEGMLVSDLEQALGAARRLGFPVVVKPLDGNHGRGVTTGIAGREAMPAAFDAARRISRRVIVERQLPGADHRILVVGGKIAAVAERMPARVTGDGSRSIADLIAILNQDPRRGVGHKNMLTRILVDDQMRAMLARQDKHLDSVPLPGEVVVLRGVANVSTGGTAIDRTDDIHPENALIAEQAADALGLDVAGIDFLSPDIARPVQETGGGIVEVNASPGFRMHLEPSEGRPRDVARPVIEALFPRGARSRIPIFAITGTNGKSTTARMVARILCEAGRSVGLTTTSGVYFNGHLLHAADASGPKSAKMVLRNPKVDVAVLETARGGILREGLGFDRCEIGAVLNISSDHLGLKGIETLEDLAAVKSVVVESVARRGHSILNFDDALTRRMARHAGGRIVWFSMNGAADMPDELRAHIRQGGMAVVAERSQGGSRIVIHDAHHKTDLMPVAEIPATMEGMAAFNVENALAAVAMCAAHGVAPTTIRAALAVFVSSFEDNPGRLNIYDGHPFRVIVDFAHNPASLSALGAMIGRMRPDHDRVIGMVSIPGDRRDEDIREIGRLAATIFDEVIFREGPDGRGRPTGQVVTLMEQGALEGGLAKASMTGIIAEVAALDAALRIAGRRDLLVVLPTAIEVVWQRILDFDPAGSSEPATAMEIAR